MIDFPPTISGRNQSKRFSSWYIESESFIQYFSVFRCKDNPSPTLDEILFERWSSGHCTWYPKDFSWRFRIRSHAQVVCLCQASITFRPFSVNSFAAQPPDIPEPITMASKVWLFIASMFKFIFFLFFE